MYYLYVLYNLDEQAARRFYIGITNDLDRRVLEHNHGLSNYTSKFGPWALVYYEAYISLLDVQKREKQLKNHGKGFSEVKKRFAQSIDAVKKVRDNIQKSN